MKKITNDLEAVQLIQFLYEGGPDSEEERSDIWDILEQYQVGVADVILSSEKLVEPEEALRLARGRNKPILL